MSWGWILQLAPVADELINGIKNLTRRGQRRNELIQRVSQQFQSLYNSSLEGLQRDVALISGWKPIVSRVQLIGETSRSWDMLINVARRHENPEIALHRITPARVQVIIEEIAKISAKMADLEGKARITWSEGGANLRNSVDLMASKARDLQEKAQRAASADDLPDQMRALDDLEDEVEDLRDNTLLVFNFWDAFLKDLAENALKAPAHFTQGLQPQIESTIELQFDNTRWADIFGQFYAALESSQENP